MYGRFWGQGEEVNYFYNPESKYSPKRIRVKFLLFKLLGSHSLLQGVSLTQGMNPGLLWQKILYHLTTRELKLKYVTKNISFRCARGNSGFHIFTPNYSLRKFINK